MNDSWHYYYIKNNFETAILNTDREPRFYANLGFDGGLWYGNGRYKDVGVGTTAEQPYVVTAKASEPSGKLSDIRYSKTGYYAKKPSHFESAFSTTGALTLTRYTFPIYRLGDLYLMYAEALNETLEQPNEEVFSYVDSIRSRAGLENVRDSWLKYSKLPNKPMTKDGMREIIQHERGVELAFEGKRLWDLRRWKKAHIVFNEYVKGWNVAGKNTADYYKIVYIEKNEFFTKNYLWSIRLRELRTNTNLVQNPLW
ncbi:MAG: RagB/SusD family nutrient uptake outer membrane protein [Bacteroidales bacterium]|nr:RagB/SusD family nutrient uptake outer membrane protein [Bacteroidales bacterium]